MPGIDSRLAEIKKGQVEEPAKFVAACDALEQNRGDRLGVVFRRDRKESGPLPIPETKSPDAWRTAVYVPGFARSFGSKTLPRRAWR